MEKTKFSLERKIGLWEGTCFESFLYDKTSGEYIELNFSGTGYWNAFILKLETKNYLNTIISKTPKASLHVHHRGEILHI